MTFDEVNDELHGIHSWCYQSFTSYLKRKRAYPESTLQCPSVSKRLTVSEASLLFPYEWGFFCGKVRKSVKQKNLLLNVRLLDLQLIKV